MFSFSRALNPVGLLAWASIAHAQALPAIVECTWGRGGVETYKISPLSWQQWNSNAWKWEERPCPLPENIISENLIPGSCNTFIDDNFYKWEQKVNDKREGVAIFMFDSSLTINRNDGTASWRWARESWFINKSDPMQFSGHLEGTCRRIPDPALQSKPAPKL
jgi:hypothetical protein